MLRLPYFLEKKINDALGTFHLTIQTEIRNPDGKLVKRHKQMCKSFTGNFLQALYMQACAGNTTDFVVSSFNGGNNTNIKATDGFNASSASLLMKLNAAANSSAFGIVCGTGSSAPTALDYKLETLISSGSGAGQLSYLAQGAYQAPSAVGNTTSFILQRLFQNNSAGEIDVAELGIYFSIGAGAPICIARDLVTDPILAGQSYTVQYTYQVTT